MEKELISRAELAELAGVSLKTVIKWDHSGRLPGKVQAGRLVKYRLEVIKKRIEDGCLLLSERGK
ncbi:MAG: helix-turn-helix transcriptional regulator [Chitinispirillaceae bacterium]